MTSANSVSALLKTMGVVLIWMLLEAFFQVAEAVPASVESKMEQIFTEYQRGKWSDFKKESLSLLRSSVPQPEKELVLFWLMQAALEQEKWTEVILYGDRVKSLQGTRQSYALYAKGVAYLQLGQTQLALRQFKSVIRHHRGSPASQKAWMKLRLMKAKLSSSSN